MRAHKKPGRPLCEVAGCPQALYCRGYCTLHYTRWRKAGSVGASQRKRSLPGAGSINDYGYRVLRQPDHPLAKAQGKVLEHRAVLYDALGPGPHLCRWCDRALDWEGRQSEKVCVDHLNHVRTDNRLENLVVSCLDCNAKRRAAAAWR